MRASPQSMLSLAAISRRLDIPYSLADKLAKSGVLQPDSIAVRTRLFRESRIPALRDAVARSRSIV